MSDEKLIAATSARSLRDDDIDEIQLVSQRISQIEELRKSVDNLNRNGELDDIKEVADDILQQLSEGHNELQEKKNKIDELDEAVKQLEMASKADYKRLTTLDTALIELEHEKSILRRRLSSLEKLNLYIDIISYKIYEMQHDYTADMEILRKEKEELLCRKDVDPEDLHEMLSEIDKRIQTRQMMHITAKSKLEKEKIAVEQKSQTKVVDLNLQVDEIKRKRSEALLELDDQKLYATPSERRLIDREIELVDEKYRSQLEAMKQLQAEGWEELGPEEKLAAALENHGIKVTKSGKLLTETGKELTLQEANDMGIFNELNLPWDIIELGLCNLEMKKVDETDESDDDEESETVEEEESICNQMASEDVNYLKDTLGKPLTLAMAEILMKQPRDPIHYLAHWLFKYRYNQEVDDTAKGQISELIAERARVAKERWQAQVQEEAQRAVLNLIVRVEEEIMRRELERAQKEQEAENEEAADEFV